MGLLRLAPLLASFQMLLPWASPAGVPPPPNITVTPEKLRYLIGDTVSIRCVAPWSKEKIQGFQFSGTSGWAVDVRTGQRAYTYRFNVTGPGDGGKHACTYTVLNQFRRPVRSQESKSIVISVKDRPPRPTLALTPSAGVAIEGQPLVFLCTASVEGEERQFHFYKGKVKVLQGAELSLGNTEAQLRVPESNGNHSGNFTCGYEEKTEGRWISSYLSRAVEILVKEPAPPPRLAVDPPSGVVSENSPLHVTCAASREDFGLRFRFYRNGVEIPPGHGGSKTGSVGNFSRLFFPQSSTKFSGRYSCGVEEDVGGTWVPSPRSEAVEVTVKALPPQPLLLSDPPSGQVVDGDPLLLTCAASRPSPPAPRKFSFYKDGAQRFSETTTGDRSVLSIAAADAALANGRFTCRYEEKVSETWVPSPFSQATTVVTQARPRFVPLVAGVAAGVAALLLALLLVVGVCRRRRGSAHWKGLHNKDDPSTYPMANVNGLEM